MNFLNRKKGVLFCGMFLYALSLLLSCYSYAESDSFLKPGGYYRAVVIENPENNPLAEAFLRNGITVYSKEQSHNGYFIFKTTNEGNKFIVLIYHKPSYTAAEYVGKYTYYKKKPNEPTSDFINSFVKWMFERAWAN